MNVHRLRNIPRKTKSVIIIILLAVCVSGFALARFTARDQFQPLNYSADNAKIFYVSAQGNDKNEGIKPDKAFTTIQQALNHAQPGDHIELADGNYFQSPVTVRDGTKNKRITIRGGSKAVVRGEQDKTGRVFQVFHDYTTLEGFTIDGKNGRGDEKAQYQDKLIYVLGKKPKKGVEGLRITRMNIQNAGGECIRLRYFAVENEISHSTIENCGVYDFRFKDGGKNGEGIYIGTAPEQRNDGNNPTDDPDESAYNHIHHNRIRTHGNECVDIKEAATHNLVEHNTCEYQKDPESGGLDARGDFNVFRYNIIRNNEGAGVRLGGDEEEDGVYNDVYGNTIADNIGIAVKITRVPQGKICDNRLENNSDRDSGPKNINPSTHCK